jgi:hypothetical protein
MSNQIRNCIHPEAAALVAYWNTERGDRVLPGMDSINPLKLKRWIGDLSIVDLHDGPKRFYVRLHGGRTQERVGNDMTRGYFEDVFDPKMLDFALAPYRAAEKAMRPTHSFMIPRLVPAVFEKLERLVLPFGAEEDGEPKRVSSFVVWAGPTGLSGVTTDSVYDSIAGHTLSDAQVAAAVQLDVLTA